jgi:hypothetical protein
MFQFPAFASNPLFCSGIRYPHLATEDATAPDGSLRQDRLRPQSLKVGFPIRKSPDQSLFAAPRSLSQRTTSFIASQRQGIHQMPFSHLIALIIDAHRPQGAFCSPKGPVTDPIISLRPSPNSAGAGRSSRPFKSHETCPPRHRCGQTPAGRTRCPRTVARSNANGTIPIPSPSREQTIRTCLLFTMTR